MRTVAGGNAAQPTSGFGPNAITAIKIEVADSSDVLQDLTTYTKSVEYESSTDEIVDAATVVFKNEEGASSLAPLMTATPPVALGRRIVLSINAGSGSYKEVFRGRIDNVEWPERFGDVKVECRDQAGVAADTWVEDRIEYSTVAGVDLEDVMQGVADDNLTTSYTLYFPAATSALVAHVSGDAPYGPFDQTVLNAERALAESIGWTIRWRHYDASASDWKWTVFEPSRTKTVPDHTFGVDDYWNVTQIGQSIEDIRNVVEVEFTNYGGARSRVVVEDATSIAAYGRRYMKISEASDSPINTTALATTLAEAALSDLKDPDALLEIECPYFWPGEVGVDLYRFTANDKHFSSDQDLAAMAFRHRIAVGERATTWITVRGKPSGGVLMWKRRIGSTLRLSDTAVADDLKVFNVRETGRADTTVTLGWSVSGDISEIWVYYATPAQPLASDVWATFVGVPSARLTPDSTSYSFAIPDYGSVTYIQIVPVGVRTNTVVRGDAHRYTLQGEQIRLIQRATVTVTSNTTCTVVVAVANPITGGDVSIAHSATGCSVDLTSPQSITSGSVTSSLDTTGTKTYVVTRPAYLAGAGRVVFTASCTDRISDVDSVDIPPQDRDFTSSQITTTEITDLSISTPKLAANAVTAAKIAANTITANEIATNAITADEISAGAVTAGKISVTSLSAISADMGTLTAGKIDVGNIEINAATEQILFGSATAPATGLGIFIGKDGSDYELRAGDPSGAYIHWNGSALSIVNPSVSGATITSLASGSNESLLGLSHDLVFSASDNDTVAWAAGTITFSNGASFSISSGNTGNVAALTYIYLDPATSSTVLQTTTTASTAVGHRKVLVATAKNVADAAKLAEFTVFGGAGGMSKSISTNMIAANAITANEINAGAVTAGKISVTSLAAIVAEIGSAVVTDGTSGITFKNSGASTVGVLSASYIASTYTLRGFTLDSRSSTGTSAPLSWQYKEGTYLGHSGNHGLLEVTGAIYASSWVDVAGTLAALGDFSVAGNFTGTVTHTGILITAATAVGGAKFRLPHGTAPDTPTNGDMWTTTAGLFVRINGVTKTVTLT